MKTDSFAVSIFCTTYNQSGYISDAVESFLAQKTDFPFEILINDDASTDGTTELVLDYERRYPEMIRVVTHHENQYSQGVNNNISHLLPIARGRYIAFCEGDDFWIDDQKLQKQYDYMESNGHAVLCVHASENVNAATKATVGVNRPMKSNGVVDYGRMLESIQCFATASFFIRREAYEAYAASNIRNLKAHGDHKMSLFLGAVGSVYYFADTMSAYRIAAKGSINRALLLSKDRESAEKALMERRMELLDEINTFTSKSFEKNVEKGKKEIEYTYLLSTSQYAELKRVWGERFSEERLLTRIRVRVASVAPGLFGSLLRFYRRLSL